MCLANCNTLVSEYGLYEDIIHSFLETEGHTTCTFPSFSLLWICVDCLKGHVVLVLR